MEQVSNNNNIETTQKQQTNMVDKTPKAPSKIENVNNNQPSDKFMGGLKKGFGFQNKEKDIYDLGMRARSSLQHANINSPEQLKEYAEKNNNDLQGIRNLGTKGTSNINKIFGTNYYHGDYKGYGEDGYDTLSGFNREGVHRNGTSYDDKGFDEDGFDKDGYGHDGTDKNGFTKQQNFEKVLNNEIGGKPLEFPSGDYKHIQIKDGKLEIGDATNSGIISEFDINYDQDLSLDKNIQNLYDAYLENFPEYLDEYALTDEDFEDNTEEENENYEWLKKMGYLE